MNGYTGKIYGDKLLFSLIKALFDGVLLFVNGNACPVSDLFVLTCQSVVHSSLTAVGVTR